MFVRGWALDHIIPGPPSVHARAGGSGDDSPSPEIDTSANDDMVRRQQDQDNLQQMINDQQMLNDQMFQQQQQQMINNMNQ